MPVCTLSKDRWLWPPKINYCSVSDWGGSSSGIGVVSSSREILHALSGLYRLQMDVQRSSFGADLLKQCNCNRPRDLLSTWRELALIF